MSTWNVAIAGIAAWLLAQFLKVIIVGMQKKMVSWKTLFSPGHMPSGHSAGTVGLASAIYFFEGATTAFFVAGALAIVTIYDALTARREIGKHAAILNLLYKKKITFEELVGHTPLQVLVGAGIGCIVAYVIVVVM